MGNVSVFLVDWQSIGRVVIMSLLCYMFLIIVLRLAGKRTLSKMNAFDFIITIALGSILASSIISKDVTLLEALTGFIMLTSLQFIISWLSVRFDWFDHLVKSEPRIIFYKGEFLCQAMKEERVTQEEVLVAIRKNGLSSQQEVEAVVLETDGKFSVL